MATEARERREVWHLLHTHEPHSRGVTTTSPQLAGFVFSAPNVEQMQRDLAGALRFAAHGMDPMSAVLVNHEQVLRDYDGVQVLVRRAVDDPTMERARLAERWTAHLDTEPDLRAEVLPEDHLTARGQHLFIACLAGDTLHWVSEQIEDGDVATIVASGPENLMSLAVVGTGIGGMALGEAGLSLDSTVSDLLRYLSGPGSALRLQHRVLVMS